MLSMYKIRYDLGLIPVKKISHCIYNVAVCVLSRRTDLDPDVCLDNHTVVSLAIEHDESAVAAAVAMATFTFHASILPNRYERKRRMSVNYMHR